MKVERKLPFIAIKLRILRTKVSVFAEKIAVVPVVAVEVGADRTCCCCRRLIAVVGFNFVVSG